jgi:sec-independent protein translocase protein TatA
MSTLFLGMIGMWETVAILAVVLVLFGARKLPELARGLGTGIKEFRKATKDVNEDLQRAFEEEETPPAPKRKIPAKSENEKSVSHSETGSKT